MKFTPENRINVLAKLNEEKEYYFDRMVDCITNTPIDFVQCAYYVINKDFLNSPKKVQDFVISDMKISLAKAGYPKLLKTLMFFYASKQAPLNTIQTKNYGIDITKNQEHCELEFWSNLKYSKEFETVAGDFTCLLNKMADKNKNTSTNKDTFSVNVDEWVAFFKRILGEIYKEYPLNHEYSDDTVRHLKKIDSGLFFGFEYNEKFFRKELKRGKIYFPELRIIAVDSKFNPRQTSDYLRTNDDDKIIVLSEDLHNPYFPGLYDSVESWFSRLQLLEPVLFEAGRDNEGKDSFVLKPEIDLNLKKIAFFSLYIKTFFMEPYLSYLTKSLQGFSSANSQESIINDTLLALTERNNFLKDEISKMKQLCIDYKDKKKLSAIVEKINSGIDMMKLEITANESKIKILK